LDAYYDSKGQNKVGLEVDEMEDKQDVKKLRGYLRCNKYFSYLMTFAGIVIPLFCIGYGIDYCYQIIPTPKLVNST
jgi:hypothetical protein